MSAHRSKNFIKLGIVIIMVIFAASFLFAAVPAKAQLVDPNQAISTGIDVKNEVEAVVKPTFLQTATIALIKAADYFVQKIAYDMATYIGSGGKGQKPLLFTSNWGSYLKDTSLGAAGEFIGDISSSFGKFNLCKPTAGLKINLLLGISQNVSPPKPSCDWQQISNNWQSFVQQAKNADVLNAVSVGLAPGNSEFGLAIQTGTALDKYIGDAVTEATKTRDNSGGFKDITSVISGKVQTPSKIIEQGAVDLSKAKEDQAEEASKKYTQAISAGAFAILPSALSTFANVLLSNFTKRVMEGLFNTEDSDKANPFDQYAEAGSDKETVKAQFAYMLTQQITDSGSYDAVTEFSVCPDQGKNINNCVIDTGFATAVNQAKSGTPLTVADAIAQGFLNGDLPLISPDNPANGDPYCFRKGYCYSNLVKLRRYRILPIGWEFAAIKSSVGNPAKLKEVVDGFYKCNGLDRADEENPWCHLIDPNWVLKYPGHECRAKVSGETLTSAETPTRNDVCVDAPSCIAEDDRGKCVGGWGYCLTEKNVWRIGGDACPSYYNTCKTLTRTVDGKQASLLKNTLDYGICGAENVGCKWYARAKDLGTNEWQTISDPVYLNRKAGKCDAASVGCSELIKKGNGIRENFIPNSSFESGASVPDYWDGTSVDYDTSGVNSFEGSRALRVGSGASIVNSVPLVLEADTIYNLSVYAKSAGAAANGAITFSFANTGVSGWTVLGECAKSGSDITLKVPANDTYGRADCSFETPEGLDPTRNAATVKLSVSSGEDVWFDALMLSEGAFVQDYLASGYGAEAPRVYLKKPPEYLGCTGGETDNELCGNYARVCRKSEAGCELWTPTNGDPAVSAITTANDSCPAECVGYETWRQELTNFEQSEEGKFPLYFIPTTATDCSAAAAGCDEFTNLEAAGGGERPEYFVDFRRCMKPDPANEAVYTTWEGSNVTGYQLQTFVLKKGAAQTGESGEPPAYQTGFTDYGRCTKEIFSAKSDPDCREFYDAAGNLSYRLYSKTVLSTPDCKAYRKTESSVSAQSTADDCTSSGGVWNGSAATCTYLAYAKESVKCTQKENGCRAYVGNTGRNVRVAFADDMEQAPAAGVWSGAGISNESTVAGGHSYSITNGAGFYASSTPGATFVLTFWARGSGTLSAQMSGQKSELVSAQTPASLNPVPLTTSWQVYSFGPMRIDETYKASWQDKLTLTLTGASGPVYLDNVTLRQVNANLYLIKNTWVTPVVCDETASGAFLPQAQLGCKEYKNRAGENFNLKSFSKVCREAAVGCEALVDTKNSAPISSATFNAVCSRPYGSETSATYDCKYNNRAVCSVPVGESSCEFDVLGKALPAYFYTKIGTAYIPADETIYLVNDKSKFCAADKVGCEAVGNPEINKTKNVKISNGFSITDCNTLGGTVSGDQKICQVPITSTFNTTSCTTNDPTGKLIYDGNIAKSCQIEITPRFTVADCPPNSLSDDETACVFNTGDKLEGFPAEAYQDDYILNNPAKYDQTLCNAAGVGCEEYKGGQELLYFKDPNDRVCEYREGAVYNDETVNGWFKTGTDKPCYVDFRSGLVYGIYRNGDPQYSDPQSGHWAGSCRSEASGCIEFVDPVDTNTWTGKPRAYYYIDNAKIDRASCNGKVSPKQGCVLFDETKNLTKNYVAEETYNNSDNNQSQLVTPYSAPPKVCLKTRKGKSSGTIILPQKTCTTDKECYPVKNTLSPGIQQLLTNLGKFFGSGGKFGGSDITEAKNLQDIYTYTCDYAAEKNDTNVILKVQRDRECAEWLDCRNTVKVYDSVNNKYKNVCTSLDVCDSYIKQGESTRCNNFKESDVRAVPSGSADAIPAVLTEDIYAGRKVTWGGKEYDGYSLPNKYPISDLKTISLSEPMPNGSEDLRLTYASYDCAGKAENDACGPKNNLGNRGVCYNGQCVYGLDGKIKTDAVTYGKLAYEKLVPTACRAYPEKDSPFPSAIATWTDEAGKDPVRGGIFGATSAYQSVSGKDAGFAGANVCENWLDKNGDGVVQESELQSCTCLYRKAEYANKTFTKYFALAGSPAPSGFCSGGKLAGQPCDQREKDACGKPEEGGTCAALTRLDRLLGWDGQCLEKDLSTPINGNRDFACLTWRPVGVIPGGQDIYNQFSSAGYNQPTATTGKYYCLLTDGAEIQVDQKPTYSFTRHFYTATVKGQGDNDFLGTDDASGGGDTTINIKYLSIEDSTSGDPLVSHHALPQKAKIFAIELVPLNERSDRALLPATQDFSPGSVPQENLDLAKEWFADKGNILSRQHEGVMMAGEPFAGYSYWEARWNISWDAPTGAGTAKSSKPLFSWDAIFHDELYNQAGSIKCNDGGKPYFAVRALFNPSDNDRLVGFWTSMCNSTANGADYLSFAVNILLGEPCINIAQVVSDTGENAALTDNLWRSNYILPILKLDRLAHNPLFGSADSSVAPTASKMPWFETGKGLGSPNVVSSYAPYIDAGTHWGCRFSCNNSLNSPYNSIDDFLYPNNAPNAFWELFAKTYGIYKLRGESYDPDVNFDVRNVIMSSDVNFYNYTNPPHIAAPTSTCKDPSVGCDIWTLDSFSMNDALTGSLWGEGSLFTHLKFYAWADHNHMPLISRTVDWNGDGKDIDRTTNSKYKNFKPYCDAGGKIGECAGDTGLTCNLNSNDTAGNNSTCAAQKLGTLCSAGVAHFGNSSDACKQDYFDFTHVYVCTKKLFNKLPTCSATSGHPCKKTAVTSPSGESKDVCVFKPQVQVIDNWHYCNSSDSTKCDGIPCFGLGGEGDSKRADCTVDGNGWTNFAGEIDVTPQ